MADEIRLAHGHGGSLSLELVEEVILPALGSTGAPTLDAALLPELNGRLAMSTDSYTVTPVFFPGGDIGKLAVCGTMNDVAMMAARPAALSLGVIVEEGFPMADFRRIMESVGGTAEGGGAKVVTGDTKVVARGACDGIFINTTGVGVLPEGAAVGPERIEPGDVILLSGTIGDHGIAILNARHQLNPGVSFESDCAVLWPLVEGLLGAAGGGLHALRDPTRGGLAATLGEFAHDTGLEIGLEQEAIPVRSEVAQVLDVLGMDALTLANEGKLIAFVAPEAADEALAALKALPLGAGAAAIGRVGDRIETGRVILETAYGTRRVVEMPAEEGLPRIC